MTLLETQVRQKLGDLAASHGRSTLRLSNVPGRKSDVNDVQWLQQLHQFGLLRGSFRPTQEIVTLPAYLRQRESLVHG